MYVREKFSYFVDLIIIFHSLSIFQKVFDFEQNQLKMTDFYVEGRKMVGNRQIQNIFWNSKILSDFESLDCIYLTNSRIYGHLKLQHHFLTTNFWKNSFFFVFFCFFDQNHQISTNVEFCDKYYCRSLVETLKYLVYKFYYRKTHFEDKKIFWIEQKNM